MAQRDRQAPPTMLGDDTQWLDLGGAGRLVEPDRATCRWQAVSGGDDQVARWVVGPELLGTPELVGVEAARGVARDGLSALRGERECGWQPRRSVGCDPNVFAHRASRRAVEAHREPHLQPLRYAALVETEGFVRGLGIAGDSRASSTAV